MKYAKVKLGMVPPVCLACLFLFVCLTANFVVAQDAPTPVKGYAVQIAAVRSQQVADELRSGLLARGLDAYWVKGSLPGHGMFYRVRVGRFPSVERALTYAEMLLDSGLLEAYAVTNFERPSSPALPDMLQASTEVQEFLPQRAPSNEFNEVLSALNARRWWLPANRSLFAGAAPGASMTQREMLVFALGRQQWRLTNDLSVLVVRSVSGRKDNLASNPPARTMDFTNVEPVRPVQNAVAPAPVAQIPTVLPPPVIATTSNVSATAAPTASLSGAFAAEGPALARPAAPDIGRGGSPTARKGIGYGVAAPRLQGRVEMLNGQLVLKLRNLDEERGFTGLARITLSDDRHSNDVAPLQFNLPPDTEQIFPVSEAAKDGDSWMLMVYDDGGAMRLLRGASLGQKPAASETANNANPAAPANVEAPPYVTGTYDATMPPGTAGAPPVPGIIPTAADLANRPMNSGNLEGGANPGGQNFPPADNTDIAGRVSVVPKLIAATTENVTMEFDISAPRQLNYISVTMLAGDYRDTRQALMSTPHGRVPFLVPAAQANGTFSYEIRDESGRVLSTGGGDFRQLGRGN